MFLFQHTVKNILENRDVGSSPVKTSVKSMPNHMCTDGNSSDPKLLNENEDKSKNLQYKINIFNSMGRSLYGTF